VTEPTLFPMPVEDHRVPQEPIARDAYVRDDYRFWLRRAWGSGPQIGWIMLNPSRADALRDDPTLWRIMGFSLRWGYGALTVVNLYPYRTPDVDALRRWRSNAKDVVATMFTGNATLAAHELRACDMIVAAWGNGADRIDTLFFIDRCDTEYRRLTGKRLRLWSIGTTADGDPKHPLARGKHRVPDDFKPVLWRQ